MLCEAMVSGIRLIEVAAIKREIDCKEYSVFRRIDLEEKKRATEGRIGPQKKKPNDGMIRIRSKLSEKGTERKIVSANAIKPTSGEILLVVAAVKRRRLY